MRKKSPPCSNAGRFARVLRRPEALFTAALLGADSARCAA
jgi:hypothetical protein